MSETMCKEISTVGKFLKAIETDTNFWKRDGFFKPWFRGLTSVNHKLLPSILRAENADSEFNLTKKFRLMAPAFGETPHTGRLDQWLSLMQHHGAPTRLLDWTESPLIACFFAVEKAAAQNELILNDAAIFALDPAKLNLLSLPKEKDGEAYFPNTWTQNPVLQTIKFAFNTQDELVIKNGVQIEYLKRPSAIYPSIISARIMAQKGRFTLHGSIKKDLETIFSNTQLIEEKHLVKYRIPKECVKNIYEKLLDLGITYTTLFPDLDGLAKELKSAFQIKNRI